ncbi:biotin-dependent carboxyltransferase family protein [Thermovenabulum gondwanense]|uniref:KipI antagonist n=1 Tax=Thermovenabulum gondwanense TaxID=520767 RepID=A0A161PVK6_9FIRM|nr:biotin-dependent carboxyltransferase family protein [Thermovenabulum gondwanense]KYO66975.1 KipI antagonist [Thermovenabulum gondwanense]
MEVFKVLNPGLFTTIQDMGRYGYEHQGVPTSGAADEFSFKIANILLENPENCPALEITMMGPHLEALNKTFISVTGAQIPVYLNGNLVPNWSVIPVKKGDTITFGQLKSGCRAYLAVKGGFEGDFKMGSFSTYTRGNIGGYMGRRLLKDDILKAKETNIECKLVKVRDEYIPKYPSFMEVRVILGPQDDYFEKEMIDKFLSSEYTISKDSDRMGLRLEGPEIKAKKHDIITDGLVPGAVQVPANGKPIVMLKDAQTTGGYVKIATLISPDLDRLAQLKPGDRIKFKAVTVEEAHKILAQTEEKIRIIKETAVPLNYYNIKVKGKEYFSIVEVL